MYEYKAYVTKVYDGDTITVDIDLGLGVWLRGQTIRLAAVDAPEIRGEEREAGLVSRDWLRSEILDRFVTIKTYKDKKGKYGRWIADVYLDGAFINETLVLEGLAKIYGE